MDAYFLDSSALAKRYLQENGSAWVKSLMSPSAGNLIYVADITAVEVISAVTRRSRGGSISLADAAVVIANVRDDFAYNLNVVEITSAMIRDAMPLAEKHALRAYDAVQLSAAIQMKQVRAAAKLPMPKIASADTELNSAAAAEGFSVDDPNAHP